MRLAFEKKQGAFLYFLVSCPTGIIGKDMPTDADGKQEEEDAWPKRIDYKEDAIEQSDPYHSD